MATLSINTEIRRITGQQGVTVSDADISQSYISFGLDTLNKITSQSLTVSDYTAATLSKRYDMSIVAEFAAFRMDQEYGVVRVDPETGRPVNKHWDNAMLLLTQCYGTYIDGNLVLPNQMSAYTPDFTWGREDSTLQSDDTDKETLADINKRISKFGSMSSQTIYDPDEDTS